VYLLYSLLLLFSTSSSPDCVLLVLLLSCLYPSPRCVPLLVLLSCPSPSPNVPSLYFSWWCSFPPAIDCPSPSPDCITLLLLITVCLLLPSVSLFFSFCHVPLLLLNVFLSSSYGLYISFFCLCLSPSPIVCPSPSSDCVPLVFLSRWSQSSQLCPLSLLHSCPSPA